MDVPSIVVPMQLELVVVWLRALFSPVQTVYPGT
jgi:hypothetical protein